MADDPKHLPYFLESLENLLGHFDEHFAEGATQRGDHFVQFVKALVPATEIGAAFPAPEISEKKSHDHGVDLLTAENDAGEMLCVQSKYKVPGKQEFDSIISKFRDYEARVAAAGKAQHVMFDEGSKSIKPVYLIVTSTKLERIVSLYESTSFGSKEFYGTLGNEHRLHVVDGPQILQLLQRLYRQAYLLPADVRLRSPIGWLKHENVRIGAVTGSDLVALYQAQGDALFFENIRDFLGLTSGKKNEDRVTVNAQISNTIQQQPKKMLERNNGITFRAEAIDENDSSSEVVLHSAAIVNGCQTTMCLTRHPTSSADCLVLVKVVVTSDAWEVATSANYQNPVSRIELDLARYLRPQLVQKVATDLGYGTAQKTEATATGVLTSIYRTRIDYDEMKLLYLGIFSRRPNNLFEGNYTELRIDVLAELYADPAAEETVFKTLFLFLKESRDALEEASKAFAGAEYAPLFKRFFQEDKPRYRVYLAVLAACGALRLNIGDRASAGPEEAKRTGGFLRSLSDLLVNRRQDFIRTYIYAFEVLAQTSLDITSRGSDADVQQSMFGKISGTPFDTLYKRLLMRLDAERAIQTLA